MHAVSDLATKISRIHHVVDYIHIREKLKSAHEILSLLQLLDAAGVRKEKIVLHDRLDIALLTNNPNIHLPSHSLPVKNVRTAYPQLRIGRSVHSIEEAQQAEADGADYVLYGHCFETQCKAGKVPNGIDLIRQMKKTVQIPIFAVGGITLARIPLLQEIQADGVALMSSIFNLDDPHEYTCTLYTKCQENKEGSCCASFN
ncbi:MAG: thiamine phosphate synthase [Lysinibacillus sp.]